MSDMSYVYAVARIRVKEKTLLTDADVAQMVTMKDEKAVLAFLEDKGWGDANTTGNADKVLAAEEKKNRDTLKELVGQAKGMDALSYPQMYHNLKTAIKEVCTSEENEGAFYKISGFGREELVRILQAKEFSRLPEHMTKAAKNAYELMLHSRDGQRCDVVMDRACLEAMQEAAQKSKDAFLKDYIDSQIAVTDIKIAVRSEMTGKSRAFLEEALAPSKSLNVSGLAVAASQSKEALLSFLEGHGFADAAEALRESASAFERWCDNRLIRALQTQKRNIDTAGPVIAYYLARENEIKTARIIMTAKANGFSEEATRERVREMYG